MPPPGAESDRERFERSMEIFDRVSGLPEGERAAALARACGDDGAMLAQIERMLAHASDRSSLFGAVEEGRGVEAIAGGTLADLAAGDDASVRIEGYEIVRELGRGGMGMIYEARQLSPSRRVAIKLVHAELAHGDVLRRFDRESLVLGQLQHPGIAQIHEAGVAEVRGVRRPYFSMEFVDGLPLDRHAAEAGLGTRDRLELLARVCDAVGYANERGVIHRDLKPGNVLVVGRSESDGTTGYGDRVGSPKVLDFGIARVSDPSFETTTIETMAGQLIGTLAYMSPEQLEGDAGALDARCDVYALGVIGYELLTGRRAHQIHGLSVPEAARVIRDDDPPPLTSIDRTLAGDIATIVAKAMEKDRDRRYGSAAELAADLRRYLTDVPIVARPASTFYQLGKFARRNRGLVGGVAAAFVVLVLGVVATGTALVAALRANEALDATNRELDATNLALTTTNEDLTAVSEFQAAQLTSVDPSTMGVRLRERLLSTAPEEHVEAVRAGLASTNFTDLSRTMIEENVLAESRRVIDERFADNPLTRAQLLESLAVTRAWLGLMEAAVDAQDEVVAIRRSELGDEHRDVVEALVLRSQYLHEIGDYGRASADARRVVEWRRHTLGEGDEATIAAMNWLAITLRETDALEESYNVALETERIGALSLGADHPRTIEAVANAGALLLVVGRTEEALPLLERADAGFMEHLGPEHNATQGNAIDLAHALADLGRFEEAEARLASVIETREHVLGATHPGTISARAVLGSVYESASRYADAERVFRVVYEQSLAALGDRHPSTLTAANNLATTLEILGDYAGAERLHRATLAAKRTLFGELHRGTLISMGNLASTLRAQKRNEESLEFYRACAEGFRELEGDDSPYTLQAIQSHGIALSALGRDEEAIPLYEESLEGRRRVQGDEHPSTLNAIFNMGDLLRRQGRLAEAEPYCEESLRLHRKVLGEGHVGTCYSLANLARLRVAQGRLDEAEPLMRAAHDGFGEMFGWEHGETKNIGSELVDILEGLGRVEEAAALRERVGAE